MWKTLGRYVIIKIEAKYPERVLNAFRRHGIGVFDVSFPTRGALLLRMRAEDFFRLRAVRREIPFSAHIVRRKGMLFRLRPLVRFRPVLLIGCAAALLLLATLSTRLLIISVNGCGLRLPEYVVLRLLASEGIYPFAQRKGLDVIRIADRVRANDDRIAWIGIALDGVRCRVELIEAVPFGPTVDSKTPCNVVAAKTGAIVSIAPYNGMAKVKPGQVVSAGELLIAGDITAEGATERVLVHARGDVRAYVFYRAERAVSPEHTGIADTGSTRPYRKVRAGRLALFETKPDFDLYEVRDTSDWQPFGTLLPLHVTAGVCYEQQEVALRYTVEEMLEIAAYESERLCYDKLPKDAAIVSKVNTYKVVDGVVIAYTSIVTEESIGLTKEITG